MKKIKKPFDEFLEVLVKKNKNMNCIRKDKEGNITEVSLGRYLEVYGFRGAQVGEIINEYESRFKHTNMGSNQKSFVPVEKLRRDHDAGYFDKIKIIKPNY